MTARTRIPDWVLERAALGELPKHELEAVRRQIETDSTLRARFEEINRSSDEILARYPAAGMSRAISERLSRANAAGAQRATPRRSRWLFIGAPALGAAALVIVALVVQPARHRLESPAEMTQLKGDPQLVIHRLRSGAQEELAAGSASARAGDRLQLSYRAGTYEYGAIVSLDARGVVTIHLSDGLAAARLGATGLVSLSHSYELDDAPEFERFFLVASHEPFALQSVTEAARALSRSAGGPRAPESKLSVAAGLWQTSVLVHKE